MHYQTEEQQIEAIKNFFTKHNNAIWAAFLICMLAFMAYRYWDWHQIKVKTAASTLYESMMAASTQDNHKNVIAYAVQLTSSYDNTIYGQAASLLLAKYDIKAAKLNAAKNKLQHVIATANLPALKQIAALRCARILIDEKKYVAAMKILEKLYDKYYEFLIYELKGDIFSAGNNLTKARKAYKKAEFLAHKIGIVNKRIELKNQQDL